MTTRLLVGMFTPAIRAMYFSPAPQGGNGARPISSLRWARKQRQPTSARKRRRTTGYRDVREIGFAREAVNGKRGVESGKKPALAQSLRDRGANSSLNAKTQRRKDATMPRSGQIPDRLR